MNVQKQFQQDFAELRQRLRVVRSEINFWISILARGRPDIEALLQEQLRAHFEPRADQVGNSTDPHP